MLTRRAFTQMIGLPLLAGTATTAFAQSPRRGGTLKLVLTTESANLVPIDNTFGTTGVIGPKVNEGLLTYDLDFKPLPQLATSWSEGDDGLSLTFRLRQGVR